MPVYGNFATEVLDDYLSGKTVKAMLVTDAYVFDGTNDFRDDVTGEITGTGYTAGGVTVTGVAVSYDGTLNAGRIDADDVDFGTVTLTGIAGIIFYISTGSAATDLLIAVDIFDDGVDVTADDYTYAIGTDGLLLGNV